MNDPNIGRIVVDEHELQQRIRELGKEIAAEYDDHPPLLVGILKGACMFMADLSRAIRYLQRTARQLAPFFEHYDVLVTPTLSEPPVKTGALLPTPSERMLLELLGRIRSGTLLRWARILEQTAAKVFDFIPWTPVINATGQPAMSVPLYWNSAGLPIGIHCVGRFGDEATLYRLAAQLEQARPWFGKLAPLALS